MRIPRKLYNYWAFPLNKDCNPKCDLACSRFFGGIGKVRVGHPENPIQVSLLALAWCLLVHSWLEGSMASMKLLTSGAVVWRERAMLSWGCLNENGIGVRRGHCVWWIRNNGWFNDLWYWVMHWGNDAFQRRKLTLKSNKEVSPGCCWLD